MAKRIEAWKAQWLRGEPLGRGGHGATFRARRIDGTSASDAALKILLRQDDEERRKRMHREASTLLTLDHPGIPKLLDSNTERFNDPAVDLYLVEELIEGQTLDKYTGDNSLDEDEVFTVFGALLEVVKYCHARGVGHRDIKPDNVILPNGDGAVPVLVDYGQSFNSNLDDTDSATWTGQHLGNRFIILPELHGPESHKRDLRTNLTQLCGILFFAMTGAEPGALAWEGMRPHQRPKERALIAGKKRSRVLLNIFDRAFVEPLDQRWQSAEAIEDVLKMSDESVRDQTDIASVVRSIQGRLRSRPEVDINLHIESQITHTLNFVIVAAKGVAKERLESAFEVFQGGRSVDVTHYFGRDRIGLVARFDVSLRFTPVFEMRATGNEFVLTATPDGSDVTTFFRAPLRGFSFPPPGLLESLQGYFLRGVEKLGI